MMIEESSDMTEHKIRTFFAAIVCAFTILGVSSCALFPLSSKPEAKKADVPAAVVKKEEAPAPAAVAKVEAPKKEEVKEAAAPLVAEVKEDKEEVAKSDDATVLNNSANAVWLASLKAIKQIGLISKQELLARHIQARVRGADVHITIEKLGAQSVRLTVKATRESGNDADLSAEIFNKIKDLAKVF